MASVMQTADLVAAMPELVMAEDVLLGEATPPALLRQTVAGHGFVGGQRIQWRRPWKKKKVIAAERLG